MNILLAFNDTDASNRALERAAQLANLYESKLVVTSVTPIAVGVAPDMTPGPELQRADALLREQGVEAELVEAGLKLGFGCKQPVHTTSDTAHHRITQSS